LRENSLQDQINLFLSKFIYQNIILPSVITTIKRNTAIQIQYTKILIYYSQVFKWWFEPSTRLLII